MKKSNKKQTKKAKLTKKITRKQKGQKPAGKRKNEKNSLKSSHKVKARDEIVSKASNRLNGAKQGANKGIVLPTGRSAGKGAKSGPEKGRKGAGKGGSADCASRPIRSNTLGGSPGTTQKVKQSKTIPADATTKFKWYVIALSPEAKDDKVRVKIKRERKEYRVEKLIRKVVSLKYESKEVFRGEYRTIRRRRFPGYLLVECKLTPEVQSFLQETRGVLCILSGKYNIVAVDTQHAAILMLENSIVNVNKKEEKERVAEVKAAEKENKKVIYQFEKGMPVIVQKKPTEPWHGTEGIVYDISGENEQLAIAIEFDLLFEKKRLVFKPEELMPMSIYNRIQQSKERVQNVNPSFEDSRKENPSDAGGVQESI